MPRVRKESKMLNIKLAKPISDELDKFVAETSLTKTAAVERILSLYLAEYFDRPEEERVIFKR